MEKNNNVVYFIADPQMVVGEIKDNTMELTIEGPCCIHKGRTVKDIDKRKKYVLLDDVIINTNGITKVKVNIDILDYNLDDIPHITV